MRQPFDLNAPRKPANLTINADLLQHARVQKINLSATLEKALVEELRRRQRERWMDDNREAIAAYNVEVEKHGVFSDAIRAF
jgi:antitoxin CcdA